MQNRTRLPVFFCADYPTSNKIKSDFSKGTMCFRELFSDTNLGLVQGLTVDSCESFSTWWKVMKCPKPGVLLDYIILVLNQDGSLGLQGKILQELS